MYVCVRTRACRVNGITCVQREIVEASPQGQPRAKVLAKRQCKFPAIAKASGGHSCKAIRVSRAENGTVGRRMEKQPLHSGSRLYICVLCESHAYSRTRMLPGLHTG